MVRKIITIDEEKCTGCGLCAAACHEGAIAMADGKAVLTREDCCDGLGDCLPACPSGAISFTEREAAAYDKNAVRASVATAGDGASCETEMTSSSQGGECGSELSRWPVQIKLVPASAGYYSGCSLLVAADCTAYAYAMFHRDYIKGRVVMVGCPKLDGTDYSIKLTRILEDNDIRDITLARMEVPCCGGLEYAVKTAVENSGKNIPVRVDTISTEGQLLSSCSLVK